MQVVGASVRPGLHSRKGKLLEMTGAGHVWGIHSDHALMGCFVRVFMGCVTSFGLHSRKGVADIKECSEKS